MRYTVARTSTDVDAVRAAVAVLKKEVLHLNDKYEFMFCFGQRKEKNVFKLFNCMVMMSTLISFIFNHKKAMKVLCLEKFQICLILTNVSHRCS